VFLTLMVVGLVGLFAMAIPAFARHGHAPWMHGHAGPGHGIGHGHALGTGHGIGHGHTLGTGHGAGAHGTGQTSESDTAIVPADPAATSRLRLIPSPRVICSVLALYGAFGNALVRAAHLPFIAATVVAAVLALLVERLAVRPLWNLLFRFQGEASSPLEGLVFAEARAVVAFRNGRGIVSTVRDGRVVQLAARLRKDQANMPVKVGERLRIEDVDSQRERVTVSVLEN
jgi:hypothetical protein